MLPAARRASVAVALAIVIAAGYLVRVRAGMVDFSVNYRAGQRLQAGETLYQTADGHYMFKYLPASALVYLPLGHLPIEAAKATWFALSVVMLIAALLLVRQLVPLPHQPYLLLLVTLTVAKYLLHELRLGQINILLMVIMLLAIRALARHRDPRDELTAGALVGVATALKPYAAIFLPYLIVTRKWIAAAAACGALAVLLLSPAVFYGWHKNLEVLHEWAVTLQQSTPALLSNNDNVSVVAFFAKWTARPAVALGGSLAVLVVLALLMLAVTLRGRWRSRAAVLDGAMLLTLIPLVSPLGWDYTFLMSLLAIALVINARSAFSPGARVALALNFAIIALAVFDLMGRQAYAAYMRWSVTTMNFLVIVAALAWLRFRGQL
jgi:alpha-1,2-mannosyltransferase